MSEQNGTPGTPGIAVVGMAGRFPGAGDVEQFWANLRGGDRVRHASSAARSCWLPGPIPRQLDDPAYVPARAALDGVELFDAGFFGYSPREAEVMDPQHRLLPGVRLGGPGGRRLRSPAATPGLIGVFAGAGCNAYLLHNLLANRAALLDRLGRPRPLHRQRQGLPGHPRLLQAGAARPEPDRADGLLHLARGRAPRLPEPAQRRVRPGPGRRRDDLRAPAAPATSTRGRHPLAPTATAAPSTPTPRARWTARAPGSWC